jgi:hypothetical protein
MFVKVAVQGSQDGRKKWGTKVFALVALEGANSERTKPIVSKQAA